MSEMEERVAEAIIEAIGSEFSNIEGYVDMPSVARAAIRATLAAMREPTEAQYDALCATGKMWRDLTSREVWQTYIDAALASGE